MSVFSSLNRVRTTLFCALFTFSPPHVVISGQVDPFLQEKLRSTAAIEKLQVIIFMKNQADLQQIEEALKASVMTGRRIPVDVRYRTVLSALQELAGRTQPGFRQRLSRFVADGRLTIENSFWIRNIIVVNSTPGVIREIAAMPDVGTVFYDGYLERELPVKSSVSYTHPDASEPGLKAIHADWLWTLGYTGAGRVVMNIDSGVEGNNESFNSRWRGNVPGVNAGWAWFDPETGTTFPTDGDGGSQHGTHTMGIMCGLYESTNDTLGVAHGARWIAAKTLNLSPHTSRTIAAFQWASNPDSNINTMDDVPDAISCSWQDPNVLNTQCAGASGYYDVIDAVEALGTAVVFSAGNNGPGVSTITPPKNRLTTTANIFSVGAINANSPGYPIANFSSRGPSVCPGPDSLRIKPEVSAPGVGVRSAAGTNGFRTLDGTSMASPHVAGSIALLRQIAPFLTGTEIKHLLMNTAADLGIPGDDNTFGHGLIDLRAAYQQLPLNVGFVRGEVTNGGGPLSGVKVDFADSVQQFSGTSDVNGNYKAGAQIDTLLTSVTYTLRAQRFGYITRTDTLTIVPGDTVSRNINLVPAPGGTLQVHAYNTTTNMRTGVKVFFTGTTVVNDTTDAVAGILSAPLPEGTYEVEVDPPPPYANHFYPAVTITAATTTPIETHLRYVIEPSPTSLHDTLVVGQMSVRTLTLTNTTADSVPFRISEDEAVLQSFMAQKHVPLNQHHYPSHRLPKGAEAADAGYVSPEARGGPVPFGYEWIDSDEPGGPAFEWIEISHVGTLIPITAWKSSTGTPNADDGRTHISIPFPFSFYGSAHDSLKLCTNGWAGFDLFSTSTEYSNNPIPSTGEPNSAISPWWDDLDLRTSGAVYYYNDTKRLIVQYNNVPHYAGTPGTYTFQIILNSAGAVLFQYLRMEQSVNSATIGIENPDGIMGLMVTHNVPYVHDSLAILFRVPDATWLSGSPSSGTIPPNSSQDIEVMFDADGLTAGATYGAGILVYATHPDIDSAGSSPIIVPVSLTVPLVNAIADRPGIPEVFTLSQNYPNPFNPMTAIEFGLPERAEVRLRVFDILGREIRSILAGDQQAGYHLVEWDGSNNSGNTAASGLYLYRFEARGVSGSLFTSTRKLLLVR